MDVVPSINHIWMNLTAPLSVAKKGTGAGAFFVRDGRKTET